MKKQLLIIEMKNILKYNGKIIKHQMKKLLLIIEFKNILNYFQRKTKKIMNIKFYIEFELCFRFIIIHFNLKLVFLSKK